MIRIIFNNSPAIYECNFRKLDNTHIYLIGDNIPQNTNGFKAYRLDGTELGQYDNFTTIYRVMSNGVQFSSDGSVWIEPDKDVCLEVTWNDADDTVIPNDVDVVYKVDNVNTTINIKKSNSWRETVSIKESKNLTIVSAEELNNYTYTITGNFVNYYYTSPDPTWQDKVDAQLTYTAMMTDTLLGE